MTVSVGRKSRPEGRGVRHPTHASDCWAPRGEAPPSPLAQAGSPRGLQPVPRGVRCDSPPRASPHPSLPTRAAWEKTSRSDPTGPTASQHRGRGRSATCARGREGTPACRRLTEEKADVAGGAARPGGKSVSPKCARRLPPASFGGLPPRGGRPAPPRGSEEDPGGGPCCTGEGAANEPSATQHDEGHNPGTPRDSERAKPSQIRATPQPPRSGATATGGRRQDSAGGRGRGPQVRRRPGFGREPLRMSVLKRGCAVSLFPLRFAPSNSCQRLRKAAARSSLSSCECPLKHVVLLSAASAKQRRARLLQSDTTFPNPCEPLSRACSRGVEGPSSGRQEFLSTLLKEGGI